jgi:hypothetical protein
MSASLAKKPVLVRNAEQVQGLDDHVERRHQDGLREVGGEIFIVLLEARPEPGCGLTQVFAVELHQARRALIWSKS